MTTARIPRPKASAVADVVASHRNPAVVAARKLAQRKHRRAEGRFLVEGLQLIKMALDAGHRPLDAFHAPAVLDAPDAPPAARALPAQLAAAGARLHAVTPDVLSGLCERDDLQGVVATFATFGAVLAAANDGHGPPSDAGDAAAGRAALDAAIARRRAGGFVARPDGPGLVVVLDRLQDPGNLGALVRTADAAGADAVVCVEPSVDAFDPRSVRGSMGSLFTLPLGRAADVGALAGWLAAAGYALVGADAHAGATWGDGVLDGPGGIALVLGNEARGLSPELDARLAARVRLPMVGQAESLNVAVAGGILMYAWLRAATR